MDSRDVDTSRFESWPLLQPNEIGALPTMVLRASMAELKKVLGQGSDESDDVIIDYARRQQERAKSILLERAAQDRVRALLEEDFTNLSMAHFDGWSAKRSVGCDRDTLPSSEHDYREVTCSDYAGPRIPPQLPRGEKLPNMDPSEWNKDKSGEMHQRASTTSARDLPMNDFDSVLRSKADEEKADDGSPGEEIVDRPEHRSAPCVEWTNRQKQHSKFQGGRPSFNNAMHEKWGSVFVVEGSQRRRRMPVRKRSVEDEDSTKASEEQIRKERRERREASLRRLLARKEKRAHQQEARRKRKAAAARKAPAVRAGAAATTKEIATMESAGVISLQSTKSTSTQDATPRLSPRGHPRPGASTTSPRDFDDDKKPGKDITPLPPRGRYVGAEPSDEADNDNLNNLERTYRTTADSGDRAEYRGQQLEVNRSPPGNTPFVSDVTADSQAPSVLPIQNRLETERPQHGSCGSSEVESVSGGDSTDGDLSMNEQATYVLDQDEVCQPLALHDAMSIFESPEVTEAVDFDECAGASDLLTHPVEKSGNVSVANLESSLNAANENGVITTLADRADEFPQSVDIDECASASDLLTHPVENSGTVSVANLESSLNAAVENGVIITLTDRADELPQSQERLNSLDGLKSRSATCLPGDMSSSDMTFRGASSPTTQVVDVSPQTTRVVTLHSYPNVPKIKVDSGKNVKDLTKIQSETEMGKDAGGDYLERPGLLDFRTNPDGPPDAIDNSRAVDFTGRYMPWEIQRPQSAPAPNAESKISVPPFSGMTRTNFKDFRLYKRSLSDGFTSVACNNLAMKIADDQKIDCVRPKVEGIGEGMPSAHGGRCNANSRALRRTHSRDWGAHLNACSVYRVKTGHLHEDSARHITPLTSHALEEDQSSTSSSLKTEGHKGGEPQHREDYGKYFPQFAAVLSVFHSGRALTREADCSSLPLTSAIMSRGRTKRLVRLTAAEERSCLQSQWKLYSIYVRVIKDYAAVFSYGEGWPTKGGNDPSSLVYSDDPSALHYRVCSKARPEVYNIVTDVLNKRCKHWEELPTGLGLKTTWNLLWTWSKPRIQYSNLLTWQKVNHFPNSRELTRKDLLSRNVSRFVVFGGRLAKEFRIIPQTFVLPHEFNQFVAAFTSSGRLKGNHQPEDSGSPNGPGLSNPEDHLAEEKMNNDKGNRKAVWIMKPVGMSRGRGIRLIDDIKNISYADKVVVQRYIDNPLLLNGYKFDLRLYVLVTSFNSLEAFIYKEGFARLSTHLYEKGNIDNRFIHLTNSSIQCLNESKIAFDSPLLHANSSEAGGTKITLSYLWKKLTASGEDVEALWAAICSVVVKSLVCVEGSIPNQPNCFELFGYDVLIDERLKPWLIEVNTSPSMSRENHVDRQVKEALIFDTIHLVNPLPFNRQRLVEVLERRLSEAETSRVRPFQRVSRVPQIRDPRARPRKKDQEDLERDLEGILCGRRPRKVGELPRRLGNFVRLCPATATYRHALRLRQQVVRQSPGEYES